MSVTLRKKSISRGKRKSLYLDFYPPIRHTDTGLLTRREFLNLYLFDKPVTNADKEYNSKTLLLAQNVCAKRLIDIKIINMDFWLTQEKMEISLILQKYCSQKKGTNADGWDMSWRYLESYTGAHLTFRDLTSDFCEEYRDYLLSGPGIGAYKKPIGTNTAGSYFGKFRSVLKIVYKSKLIDEDLYNEATPIEEVES